MKQYLLTVTLFLFVGGCSSSKKFSSQIIRPVLEEPVTTVIQQETDAIFTLLCYALVYKDWQYDTVPRMKRRGYNIGALLVDKENKPVACDLNCITATDNATQHGEVRVITGYLQQHRGFSLAGFSMYTTLEPCVMCAGMMTMTSVGRVVYGQKDVEYSRAFERLAIDTRPIGGFPPYPRKVVAQSSPLRFCKALDEAYQDFLATDPEKVLAKFLASEPARQIYQAATEAFTGYEVQQEANRAIYEAALAFFKTR